MTNEFFSYEKWVEEALRDVIKRALEQTAVEGLPGDHHFFITFLTGHDGVNIPVHLKAEHPEEMTIVLQHQFHDLIVTDDGFSVSLSFSGRACYLAIPFSAITAFADPAVNFVLQLKMAQHSQQDDGPAPVALESKQLQPDLEQDEDTLPADDEDEEKMGEVIALDTFRKK
mgnify:FL=1